MRTNGIQTSSSVATNAPGELTGLRDPVDPWNIIPIWEWIIAAAIVLLVLGLAALAFWLWWRKRQRQLNQVPEPPPPVPPHVRAREQLEQALRYLSDPNRFCTELSRILRRYLEERFGWNAPDRTTEEFLHELRAHEELPESLRTLLAEFLVGCDLVKFARHDPTETELRQLHRAALRVVGDTVPQAQPPPAATPGNPPAPVVPASS